MSATDFGFRPRQNRLKEADEFGFIAREGNQEEKESIGANIGRQIGRTGARVAETVLGAPRALGEFGEMLIPEKLIGKGAEKIGLKEPVEKGFELAKKYAPYKLFPKSEDVRGLTKKLFGEKLEPKNEWEAKADDFITDFAALALPLPGSQLKLLKPALLAAGGNVANHVVGELGGTEKQKTYAKLGTMLVGSLINPKSAEKLKNELYSEARSARSPDAMVDAFDLKNNVKNYRKQLQKGGSAPYKTATLKKLDEIEEAAKSGDIQLEELEKFKVSINSMRSGLYEEFKGNKPGRKLAKSALDKVSNIVDKALDVYGISHPEWEAFYRSANEVHGAIAQSYKVRNNIAKIATKYGHHAVLPLLGIGHFAGAGHTIEGLLATGAAGAAALTAGEISARIWKSPTLRKHYMNLVNSALKDDAVAIEQNLMKLEKELSAED